MNKEIEASAKQEFHKALLALHGDIDAMTKDESNPFFKSKYVPLNKMLKILKPTMQKHGFILSQPTDVANGPNGLQNVVFSIIVHAPTGVSESAKLGLPELNDLQKLGGAITYARRYTLSALLGLIEEDDDGNFSSGKTAAKAVKAKDRF